MNSAASDSTPPVLPKRTELPALSAAESRQWAVFLHLAGFANYVGIPFGSILGPLVLWLLKRDQSEFVNECGKEALNFHLSMLIFSLISIPLIFVFVGFFTLLAISIIEIIFTIIAMVKASDGEIYRYPLSIRFIS